MNGKSLKQAIYLGLATAGLALADQMIGNSSLSEMASLMYNAPANGSPITAQLSLFADNIGRLSLPGLAAVGTGAVGAYKTLEALVTKPKEKKQESQ
ncbi:MAG: hypothetical protein KKB39_01170 [Nanoarchaeota archaeon]|nr:hypothetical protein [Nanoarchaeota archaeon]